MPPLDRESSSVTESCERRKRADFHFMDQAGIDGEAMTDVPVEDDRPGQFADNLVYMNQHLAGRFWVERSRFNARVDLRPLLGPVGADLLMTASEAAFEGLWPDDVRGHGGKGGV